MEKPMTIKMVSRLAGVGVETVRFYEREMLIPEPPRSKAGYRQYCPEAVSRIKFIKRAQALGFALPEIKEFLELKVGRNGGREKVRKKARKKIADIEMKIQTLQQIKQTLEHITNACRGNGPLQGCPILRAFEGDDSCYPKPVLKKGCCEGGKP